MRRYVIGLGIILCCCFIVSGKTFAESKQKANPQTMLNELLRGLEKGGISQQDLKSIDKLLVNMLTKGGKKDDIEQLILGMSKHGVKGQSLSDSVRIWNDILNAGESHNDAADLLSKVLGEGKNRGLQGNELAAVIQEALHQRNRELQGKAANASLNELLQILANNGVKQGDLRGIEKQLGNILGKGGNKDVMRYLLLEMVKKGLTGTSLIDAISAWNNVVNGGLSHQASHDIIAQVLHDATAKGWKDKELAAAIEAALRRGRGISGSTGDAALNDLLQILADNGIRQSDLRGIEKQLGNILGKGGNKDVMRYLLLDMVRKGLTGTYLIDSVSAWNDVINGGLSNQASHDIIAQVLHDATAKGWKDKELVAAIEDALQRGRGGYGGTGDAALNDLLQVLGDNGIRQSDIRGIEKQLGNILGKGGNKDVMRYLLLDMVRKGLTGTNLIDSVSTWSDLINGGLSTQASSDIIANTLSGADSKGIRDQELASLIQEALKKR